MFIDFTHDKFLFLHRVIQKDIIYYVIMISLIIGILIKQ